MADQDSALNDVLEALRRAGATKLAWTLEHAETGNGAAWTCLLQAANEMGAPVPLTSAIETQLQHAIQSGRMGAHEPGLWVMDTVTGEISAPQPRPGDGAGAPGIAERGL
jgi:hypothetical protein